MSVGTVRIRAKLTDRVEADVKFRVRRDALGEAVSFVSRALATRPVVPLLSGILLDAQADRLTLSCFDYEVSARVRVEAEVVEEGTALVPGRLLAEITRSLPAQPAEFSAEGDVVNLTCGRAEFGLVCLPIEDYPMLPESPPAVGVIDGGVLAAAVTQVASSASRDDTLPMLTAICLDVTGPAMTLAATDRYRLAAKEVTLVPADPGMRALALVPARVMVEAARTMMAGVPVTIAFEAHGDEADSEAPARARQGGGPGAGYQPRPADGLISLESGDRRFTTRLIAGEFVKYRSRFPEEFGCRAELPAAPVIEAVRRAALVADRASPVRLSFRRDQVVIEAHAEGRARAAETVAAEFSGDQPVISFNPHYLLDGLVAAAAGRHAGGAASGGSGERGPGERGPDEGEPDAAVATGAAAEAGRIRLEFNSPAKPALITTADDEEEPDADGHDLGGVPAFRYLLVPLRVPERA
jgi:DNA polymerase-3 subunit beta